jgi:elongation factor Ts
MMDCKKALESSGGDVDKAVQFLREKGKMAAAAKEVRTASQGLIASWVSADAKKGGIVEVNCETDFVARTKDFTSFVKALAQQVGEQSIPSADVLKTKTFSGSKETVESEVKEQIGKLGENIIIKRAAALGGAGVVGRYIHSALEQAPECGSLGVMVEIQSDKAIPESETFLKEISMHVAAAHPKWISKGDVPKETIDKEVQIYREQCKQMGKPEQAWDKIIQSKQADFYKQFCLMEQPYVRDSKMTIQSYLQSVAQKDGATLAIRKFVRFKVGEE